MSGLRGDGSRSEIQSCSEAVVLEPFPVLTLVVGPVDAAVVLLPEALGLRGVDEDLVDALADLGEGVVGHEVRGRALVRGVHDSPPSSLRKTPAAEMPAYIVCGSAGSIWIECVLPPAPGFQRSRVGWSMRLQHRLPARLGRSSGTGRPVHLRATASRHAQARRATSSRASARDPRAGRALRCSPRRAPSSERWTVAP